LILSRSQLPDDFHQLPTSAARLPPSAGPACVSARYRSKLDTIDCFLKELLRKVGRQSFFQLTNTASVKAQYLGEYWELHALQNFYMVPRARPTQPWHTMVMIRQLKFTSVFANKNFAAQDL